MQSFYVQLGWYEFVVPLRLWWPMAGYIHVCVRLPATSFLCGSNQRIGTDPCPILALKKWTWLDLQIVEVDLCMFHDILILPSIFDCSSSCSQSVWIIWIWLCMCVWTTIDYSFDVVLNHWHIKCITIHKKNWNSFFFKEETSLFDSSSSRPIFTGLVMAQQSQEVVGVLPAIWWCLVSWVKHGRIVE